MKTNRHRHQSFLISAIAILLSINLVGCLALPGNFKITFNNSTKAAETVSENEPVDIRIIATSDIHGKMMAYDYVQDIEESSGSLAQISSAIKEYRNDNTILVELGDSSSGNLADLFIKEDIHPMMQGINMIGYDVCIPGNHEFNYGLDFAKNYINTCNCDCLLGNVYDQQHEALAKGYTIIEKNGIKIAFIGMVSPGIQVWDAANLNGCTVTDIVEETNKIIDSIRDQIDIIIGVYHIGKEDENNMDHSGFASVAKACPDLDLILAAHGHTLVNETLENDIPVIENKDAGKTIQIVDITINKNDTLRSSLDIQTTPVEIADYPEDPEIVGLLKVYDEAAKAYCHNTIGELIGGPLVPDGEIKGISSALTSDTPMISLIEEVELYYSGADVAVTAPFSNDSNIQPGEMILADVNNIYKYGNTLYKVKMNGKQLKQYMEWAASFYQQYEKGDLTIASVEDAVYFFDSFSGVNYDIDISKPAGERIVNLTHPDGTPVEEDETLTVAVNNYRANSLITVPGIIYEEGDTPEIIETDVRSDIGDIRLMIANYIMNVKGGIITPDCDNNWKIIGNDWDEELHKKAVEMLNNGELSLPEPVKGNPMIGKITEADIK